MIKINIISLFFYLVTLLLSNKVISQSNIETVETLFRVTKIDSEFNQINTILEAKIEKNKIKVRR